MSSHAIIIVAAGKGLRMGFSTPKTLLELEGVPLLVRTLRNLHVARIFQEGVVVVSEEMFDFIQGPFWKQWELPKEWSVVVGGKERHDSVRCGLKHLSSDASSIWIHDAARPFVSKALLQRLKETIENGAHCIPMVPIRDTLKEVKGNDIVKTVDR